MGYFWYKLVSRSTDTHTAKEGADYERHPCLSRGCAYCNGSDLGERDTVHVDRVREEFTTYTSFGISFFILAGLVCWGSAKVLAVRTKIESAGGQKNRAVFRGPLVVL